MRFPSNSLPLLLSVALAACGPETSSSDAAPPQDRDEHSPFSCDGGWRPVTSSVSPNIAVAECPSHADAAGGIEFRERVTTSNGAVTYVEFGEKPSPCDLGPEWTASVTDTSITLSLETGGSWYRTTRLTPACIGIVESVVFRFTFRGLSPETYRFTVEHPAEDKREGLVIDVP